MIELIRLSDGRCSEAELNCVNRYIRRKPELMQFEIGMSTGDTSPRAALLVSRAPWLTEIISCPAPSHDHRKHVAGVIDACPFAT